MLKFFRRIRRSLLGQGKDQRTASPVVRYALYAIGEIFLVVIGILIALKINNNNQYHKDRISEIEILEEIRDNISTDFEDHNQNIVNLSNIVGSSEIVLYHLNNDLPYHDSLEYHFAWLPMGANFDAVKSGYELMLSKGANIITNDSIRQKISILYGNKYTWLRDFLKDRQKLERAILLNEMLDKFKSLKMTTSAVPRNYNALKQDEDFKVRVDQNAYSHELTKNFYLNLINFARVLLEDLEQEIDRLKDHLR